MDEPDDRGPKREVLTDDRRDPTNCLQVTRPGECGKMSTQERVKDPDADAIRSTAEGDEDAFESLVEKYRHAVLNTGYRYLGEYAEAEDVAQEIFVKVWKNAAKFKGKSKFSTWLYRIVVNHCLSHKRKHRATLVPLNGEIARAHHGVGSQVEERVEEKEVSDIVRKAVTDLPERQKMALILTTYEHKSYEEIAGIMDLSISSVTSLVFRARDNLKKKLLPLKLAGEI